MKIDPYDYTDPYDLDRLEAYLLSADLPDGTMLLSELDGFLTAIAISPEEIPSDEWLPDIWAGEMPPVAVQTENRWALGAIMTHYDGIRQRLTEVPPSCTPIFEFDVDGTLFPEVWAEGFMCGVNLRRQAWEPVFLSDQSMALVLIGIFAPTGGQSPLINEEPNRDEIREKANQTFPHAVLTLHRFWREAKMRPTTPRRSSLFSNKVGRNAPCPCGSGKKYKRCCGAG
jgi:uncharacterized protein